MAELNKRSVKYLTKSRLNGRVPTEPVSSNRFERKQENVSLLEYCAVLYNNMYELRKRANRASDYEAGRQWKDMITDPDTGNSISEENYIRKQGVVPLKTNIIRPLTKAVAGIYVQSAKEPLAVSRDKDEQELGEMMSVALQYAYDSQHIKLTNVRALSEALRSSIYISGIRCAYNRETGDQEVFPYNEDLNSMFADIDTDTNIIDKDLTTIGFLRDYSIEEVLHNFARSPEDKVTLQRIYTQGRDALFSMYGRNTFGYKSEHKNFFVSDDPAKCRVIEIWRLESKPRYYCHDWLNGTYYKIEEADLGRVEAENIRRIAEYESMGVKEDDYALIETEWREDRYYYYRYLTPDGITLSEGESPYWHGGYPYIFDIYGKTSFVEDVIDQQRFVNLYITQRHMMNGAAAKGTLVLDKTSVENSPMTAEQIRKNWGKIAGVIQLDLRNGIMPQQFYSNYQTGGDMQMVQMMLSMADKIFGVTGSMRGESPTANTPAALYQQETINSNNNIAEFLSWFNNAVRRRDYKMMMTIQQYYDEAKYINIGGKNFSEAAKWYNPEKVRESRFDLVLVESSSNQIYRQQADHLLMFMIQSGILQNPDLTRFFLENTQQDFAPRMLENYNKYLEAQAARQGAYEQQPVAEAVETNQNQM